MVKRIFQGCCAIAALGLVGCLEVGALDTGNLSVYLTDAPVDGVAHVFLQISGVDVHRKKGTEYFTFAPPKKIDLMQYNSGQAAYLLEFESLPADDYQWMRVRIDAVANVDDSYVESNDGQHHELSVITNDASGLIITRDLTIPANGAVNLTLDLDLRRSLTQNDAGDYVLTPYINVVDNAQTGNITGAVDSSVLTGSGCDAGIAVYVFSGADAAPVDFNINDTRIEPIASTLVTYDKTTSTDTYKSYRYTVGFLPASMYTVALTCDADLDVIDQNDSISFIRQGNVTVDDNRRTTYYNFYPTP